VLGRNRDNMWQLHTAAAAAADDDDDDTADEMHVQDPRLHGRWQERLHVL
jgi:hypothetical protein